MVSKWKYKKSGEEEEEEKEEDAFTFAGEQHGRDAITHTHTIGGLCLSSSTLLSAMQCVSVNCALICAATTTSWACRSSSSSTCRNEEKKKTGDRDRE